MIASVRALHDARVFARERDCLILVTMRRQELAEIVKRVGNPQVLLAVNAAPDSECTAVERLRLSPAFVVILQDIRNLEQALRDLRMIRTVRPLVDRKGFTILALCIRRVAGAEEQRSIAQAAQRRQRVVVTKRAAPQIETSPHMRSS